MPAQCPYGYFCLPNTWISKNLEKSPENVIVVSSFGNTSLESINGCKSFPVEQMLGRNIFNRNITDFNGHSGVTNLEGYFDKKNGIIYLHLVGVYDASQYGKACQDFKEEIDTKGFLTVFADLKFQYARALLLLFYMSHIMLFHHPNHVFDVTYIHLFHALDGIRIQANKYLEDILKEIPEVSNDWQINGRLCSPRVLFIFSSSKIPKHVLREALEEKQTGSKIERLKNHPIRKMELNLEYLIYRLLRKSRVITNISLNSLFAIPNNQPFVYICEDHQEATIASTLINRTITDMCNYQDPVVRNLQKVMISGIADECLDKSDSIDFGKKENLYINILSDPYNTNSISSSLLSSVSTDRILNLEHSFQAFLRQHIDEAFTKGFDDNVSRNPGIFYFEIPTASTWFSVFKKFYDFFILDSECDNQVTSSLRNSVNIELRFSKARCNKVMPLALSSYKNGLPTHYSESEHESKLAMAMSILESNARGPMFKEYAEKLQQSCEEHWKDGRIGCQVLSIMGNPCIQPKHKLKSDDDNDSSLPVMEHNSGVLYTGFCNCGYSKAQLKDFFTDKDAFVDLYRHLNKDCCRQLEAIHFPCLEPTTEDVTETETVDSSQESVHAHIAEASASPMSDLSLDSAETDREMRESGGSVGTDETERSGGSKVQDAKVDEIVVTVPKKEKVLANHHLAAMLTTSSPDGFLPKYATWSLHCLGPSSLYSHNAGIIDQPGFLNGTNFLLPWDVTVKVTDKNKWPAIADSMGKKGFLLKSKKSKLGGDITEFNVKVFLGIEYQCLRGHRFMMSGPDKVLKASSAGHVKDTAAKITNYDMPLYFPCLCSRNSEFMNAQLMRIHVVTPKAPVNVTLNPHIRVSDGNTLFIPQRPDNLAMLSSSSYWVLRLPFFYVDESQFFEPPEIGQQVDASYGALRRGCYGITEINLDR